jgi:hypothetical protein
MNYSGLAWSDPEPLAHQLVGGDSRGGARRRNVYGGQNIRWGRGCSVEGLQEKPRPRPRWTGPWLSDFASFVDRCELTLWTAFDLFILFKLK